MQAAATFTQQSSSCFRQIYTVRLSQDFVRASACIGSGPLHISLKEQAAGVLPAGFGSFAGSLQSMELRTNIKRSCLGNKTSEPSFNFRGAEGHMPSQQSCVSGVMVGGELVRPKVLLF